MSGVWLPCPGKRSAVAMSTYPTHPRGFGYTRLARPPRRSGGARRRAAQAAYQATRRSGTTLSAAAGRPCSASACAQPVERHRRARDRAADVVKAAAGDVQADVDPERLPVLEQLLAVLEGDDLVVAGVVQQHRRLGRDRAEPVLAQARAPLRQLEHVRLGQLADMGETRPAHGRLEDVACRAAPRSSSRRSAVR